MPVRSIARLGEPILRQIAAPVGVEELDANWLHELVTDLVDTMRAASGAGLAAPQIFVSRAVCVLEVSSNDRYPSFPDVPLTVLINPVVTALPSPSSELGRIAIYEGCLSIPGLRGRVLRPSRVHLAARSLGGELIDRVVEGVEAAVLQHEVDHLFGTLFVDRVETQTLAFAEEFVKYVPERDHVAVP